MKVLHDIVAVKRRQANTVIYLTDHKECIGEVVAVGPGKLIRKPKNEYVIPMTVKVGEYVMFSPRAGQDHEVDGEEVTFIREADILCVVDADKVKLSEDASDEKHREVLGEFSFGT